MKKLLTAALALLVVLAAAAQPPSPPKSMKFAGATVNLERSDLYERMDRELITVTYMHTTSILMIKRSERVFREVVPILKKHGIPEDLKYLMAIESSLDPTAYSPAGAAGLWQFMTSTGRQYGLEVNANVDERYNIVKSTEAACRYLLDAYAKYGDWMTVAAAYNSGMNGVSRRVESQHKSSAMDLWLPKETMRYMFRILAAKMLLENPKAFGFDVIEKYPAVGVKKTVVVTDPIDDLVKFAEDNGVSYMQLKSANLWLREAKLNNASHRRYEIVIPKGG